MPPPPLVVILIVVVIIVVIVVAIVVAVLLQIQKPRLCRVHHPHEFVTRRHGMLRGGHRATVNAPTREDIAGDQVPRGVPGDAHHRDGDGDVVAHSAAVLEDREEVVADVREDPREPVPSVDCVGLARPRRAVCGGEEGERGE